MGRSVANATRVGLGTASVPAVSIKGGSFTLTDSNGEQAPIETRHMDCVIIDANPAGVQRVFWGLDVQGQPKQFDDSGSPPLCFSDNGVGASTQATEPQSTSCRTCPMSQFSWQSKQDASKRSSACKPVKKLAIIAYLEGGTENNQKNNIYRGDLAAEFPFVLRVPVMSHENLSKYSARFNDKIDISEVVTRVKFAPQKVGLLEFEPIGRLDPEVDMLINKVLDAKMTDNLVGRGDIAITNLPTSSQSVIEKPAPEPAKPAISQRAAVQAPPQEVEPAVPAAPKRGRPKKLTAPEPIELEQPRTAPFAAPQNGNSGIVENPPSTPEEVEASLDSLFNLPT